MTTLPPVKTEPCPVCKAELVILANDPKIIICFCGAMLRNQKGNEPMKLIGFRINPEDR